MPPRFPWRSGVSSPTPSAAELKARLAAAAGGRLATITTEGRPHVVPCCFAFVDDRVVTAVDGKPKSTLALRRLDNVRAHPTASLVVDHYEDDWSALWWVRIDGSARVCEGGAERDDAIAALTEKYEQYRATPPPGAVIVIEDLEWRAWP